MASDSLDIDADKKSIHNLKIDNINPDENWSVGLVYGASGSGKTTLGKQLFGDNCFKTLLDLEQPIINQLPKDLSYEETAKILNGVGLNSVPCWIRPARTLSGGQRARAESALLMTQSDEFVCIDEWTSVVDRTVAKAMSHCLQKYARRNKKRIILMSCHYDVLEWLNPDWLIDCNKQKFINHPNDSFFFTERDKLKFDIRPVGRDTWKYFSKYHYLNERLPGGDIKLFGLFEGENQIGFQCFANYVPHKKNTKKIYHSNRTVIHPDYNGLGLGIILINKTSQWMVDNFNCRIMAKFSSTPIYKSMKRQKEWVFTGTKRQMGRWKLGGTMERFSGLREAGVKTYHFTFVGA